MAFNEKVEACDLPPSYYVNLKSRLLVKKTEKGIV